MLSQVDVFYDGWGEHWRWGTLVSSTAITGRPLIAFEYSDEANKKGLELSGYTLPLRGPKLRRDFPQHQLGLPGPVYDALPDGWGMLLMDQLFKRRSLNPARIGPLKRLSYIACNAIGAMSFEPVAFEMSRLDTDITLADLAAEVHDVLNGEGDEFLQKLMLMGGSAQGARPKALLYRDPATGSFATADRAGSEAWLVKFPGKQEHPEVCALEAVYAECLRACNIDTPETAHFNLPNGQAAFASKRFDRQSGMRVPMQSLAAFTGADFRVPGTLDCTNFLRATQMCTNDVREKAVAFSRVVFNVAFNNRDDHPKNFAYVMSRKGEWTLAPAYDVTFCEGPGGYHQMDIMGEALEVSRKNMMALGVQEAELSAAEVSHIIEKIGVVGSQFTVLANKLFPDDITPDTIGMVQMRIDDNIRRLL